MSLESEFGIDPEAAAAIADYFREADERFHEGEKRALDRPMRGYQRQFGPLNMAALEQIFRDHDFHTHFLAISADFVKKADPRNRVLDINDALSGKLYPRSAPFGFMVYPSREELQASIGRMGIRYIPEINLRLLQIAGIIVNQPLRSSPTRRSRGTQGRKKGKK